EEENQKLMMKKENVLIIINVIAYYGKDHNYLLKLQLELKIQLHVILIKKEMLE
ncbi:MAG: hypothetical protein EZS28_046709, partial [Streblomastix strix]